MKIGVRLFLSSMIFGIVIAVVYWLTTHDVFGIVALGLMAFALVIVAGYILVAEREADLYGDDAQVTATEAAGENMGVFALESYWPILAAVASVLLVMGVVFMPGVSSAFSLFGGVMLLGMLWMLVREST